MRASRTQTVRRFVSGVALIVGTCAVLHGGAAFAMDERIPQDRATCIRRAVAVGGLAQDMQNALKAIEAGRVLLVNADEGEEETAGNSTVIRYQKNIVPVSRAAVEMTVEIRAMSDPSQEESSDELMKNYQAWSDSLLPEYRRNLTRLMTYYTRLNTACSRMAPAPVPAPAPPIYNAPPMPGPVVTNSSGDVELTVMLGDAHQILNLRTGALLPGNHAPQATAHLQSGNRYAGYVSVRGYLPAGYAIYIYHHSQIWAVLPATGGEFEVGEQKGFGASNDVDAAVCLAGVSVGSQAQPSGCLMGTADVDILWQP